MAQASRDHQIDDGLLYRRNGEFLEDAKDEYAGRSPASPGQDDRPPTWTSPFAKSAEGHQNQPAESDPGSRITYLRLQSDFVYLAMLMDLFGRAIRGWNLGWALGEGLALLPIKQALEEKSGAGKPSLRPWRALSRKGLCEAPQAYRHANQHGSRGKAQPKWKRRTANTNHQGGSDPE